MTVEAWQWHGQLPICDLAPKWVKDAWKANRIVPAQHDPCLIYVKNNDAYFVVYQDDWIINDASGQLTTCSKHNFHEKYQFISYTAQIPTEEINTIYDIRKIVEKIPGKLMLSDLPQAVQNIKDERDKLREEVYLLKNKVGLSDSTPFEPEPPHVVHLQSEVLRLSIDNARLLEIHHQLATLFNTENRKYFHLTTKE
ncbi:MAG: hypothetical protein WC942_12090 [Clostridia bacterium]|jgi:hypothetical protein